ncbi:MAG: MYXO-CTERM sorting domain-containing protein [Kofleriaceae bacterium]|nr:MYXO-CTERM sorting domain-containing protein [Kofleriaceae bacterium]
MRTGVLAGLVVAAVASIASANGRDPNTSTLTFRRGMEEHIVAGMTFGMLQSHDSGETWHWMCEKAIRYGGNWDPDYAYSATGAIFATTYDGSLVNRDSCAFEPVKGNTFISSIALGPDDAVFMAASHVATPSTGDPGDARIYKSTDDGATFPTSTSPGQVGDWWTSIEVAPSDAQRVYLAGYRLVGMDRTQLLFKSTDGGTSFQPMNLTGITGTNRSDITIVGIHKTDPDKVYVRVTEQVLNAVSDAIFRTTNGGESWELIKTENDYLAFLVRNNGDLLVAGKSVGLYASAAASNGSAWTPIPGAPRIGCLVETTANVVWACTQNFGPEGAGIMKTTDLTSWTKMLVYSEIEGPIDCPPGTLQHDLCVTERSEMCASEWCCLRENFGIAADPTSCPVPPPRDGAGIVPEKGCCQAGPPGPSALLVGLGVGGVLLRRRRR